MDKEDEEMNNFLNEFVKKPADLLLSDCLSAAVMWAGDNKKIKLETKKLHKKHSLPEEEILKIIQQCVQAYN